jgi:hypothetical protein
MTRRYRGSFVTANPPVPAGSFQDSAAGGVWSMAYQAQYRQANLWPIPGNVNDGTLAIFALGYGGCTTNNKYTFSGCTVSAATSFGTSALFPTAAGNSTAGIFALGYATGGARRKYTYSGDVVSTATGATAATYSGSAAGNSTIGIFQLGYGCSGGYLTTRNKYTYASCTSGSATAATSGAGFSPAAAGNSTAGIFALAFGSARDKYTYAGDVVAAGTSAGASAVSNCSATGNSTVGIFALGRVCYVQTTTRQKYTYSGCTVSGAGAATAASMSGSAAGNSVVGIFALGCAYVGCAFCPCTCTFYPVYSYTTTRNKYTYSGDSVTSGGAATASSAYGGAVSNGATGVNR